MSICLWVVSDLDGSLASAQRVLAIATAMGDIGQQVTANSFLDELHLWSFSDYRRAAEVCRRNVGTLHGTQLQAHCHLGLGTLYARIGQREQARAELSAAIALYRAMDMIFWLPQAEAALAQCSLQE
jgi:hypothetical protein